jgi:hypothetical protein
MPETTGSPRFHYVNDVLAEIVAFIYRYHLEADVAQGGVGRLDIGSEALVDRALADSFLDVQPFLASVQQTYQMTPATAPYLDHSGKTQGRELFWLRFNQFEPCVAERHGFSGVVSQTYTANVTCGWRDSIRCSRPSFC